MDNIKGISIIVPAFNEGATIAQVLADLKRELKGKITYEIVVVNDGSTDNTKEILAKDPDIILVSHGLNRGYSASLKTGIAISKYDWILTFDSDGSHLARQIIELIPYAEEYDLIIGARDGKKGYDTSSRKFGRNIVRIFAEYISQSKIPDINSGFRLFKKDLAKKFWHLFPEGFSFSTTLTVAAHAHRYSVKYVFVEVNKRKGGNSTIKPARDFIGFLNLILRLAIYFKPLRVFVPLAFACIVGAFGIVIVEYLITETIFDTTFAILVTMGIQMMIFGLIAEMIVKRFYSGNLDN